MKKEKLYNVVAHRYDKQLNQRTGRIGKMNETPMTHKEAVTFARKHTKYDWRIELLEEVL